MDDAHTTTTTEHAKYKNPMFLYSHHKHSIRRFLLALATQTKTSNCSKMCLWYWWILLRMTFFVYNLVQLFPSTHVIQPEQPGPLSTVTSTVHSTHSVPFIFDIFWSIHLLAAFVKRAPAQWLLRLQRHTFQFHSVSLSHYVCVFVCVCLCICMLRSFVYDY